MLGIMLRTVPFVLLANITTPVLAQESYSSLEDYCLRTAADTPENCECGQATADRIMSDEEQAAALAMMTQQQPPQLSPENYLALTEKLQQVTSGCEPDDQGP